MKTAVLKTFDNSIDAHMLKNKLEREGIYSFLVNENLTNLLPGALGLFRSGVQVVVGKEDLEKAREVTRLHLDKTTCPVCGADIHNLTVEKRRNESVTDKIMSFLGLGDDKGRKYTCRECGTSW